jgi:hypothetical protein
MLPACSMLSTIGAPSNQGAPQLSSSELALKWQVTTAATDDDTRYRRMEQNFGRSNRATLSSRLGTSVTICACGRLRPTGAGPPKRLALRVPVDIYWSQKVHRRRGTQMLRERPAKPLFGGSIPSRASTLSCLPA